MKNFFSFTNILILVITFLFFGDLILLLGNAPNDLPIVINRNDAW